jgi:hypothetical protein
VLATALDAHKKGVITRPLANNGKPYRIPSYAEVLVEKLVAFPAGNQSITIACGGPNPVYYHTEGNPPEFGENDNGDIKPGHISTFKITSSFGQRRSISTPSMVIPIMQYFFAQLHYLASILARLRGFAAQKNIFVT